MPGRMEFQFTLPKSARTARSAGAPLRILIMADFSGRGYQEAPANLADPTNRLLLPIDVDHFDTVMARFNPKLSWPLGVSDTAITINFDQLDDFHPDALCRRLELFQALRRSRARLLNPAGFTQAVAELSSPPPYDLAQSDPTATPESEAALFDRLLGRAPATPPLRRSADPNAAAVQSLLQTVVRPHIVHTDPRQPAWVAAVDAAISEQMRAILHQPAFQRLEATWRSVHDLVVNLDGAAAISVFLLDVTQQELLRDLHTADGKLPATPIYTQLIDRGVRAYGGEPWSLLVGDYYFGAGAEDMALLAELGSLAVHAGGPFLAGVEPSALGCDSAAQLAHPAQWAVLPADAEQNRRLLRTSAVAPWIGLASPRVLLRSPYGRKADPIESFAFEEMPAGRDPDAYLWGNPAFVCARLIAAAFAENDGDFSLGDVLDIEDRPMHIYEDAGDRVMQPATEVLLGEQAMNALLSRGIMPLLGHRQRNAVRLARFQSLAEPPAALAGAWR